MRDNLRYENKRCELYFCFFGLNCCKVPSSASSSKGLLKDLVHITTLSMTGSIK